jgi:hypothetical protein
MLKLISAQAGKRYVGRNAMNKLHLIFLPIAVILLMMTSSLVDAQSSDEIKTYVSIRAAPEKVYLVDNKIPEAEMCPAPKVSPEDIITLCEKIHQSYLSDEVKDMYENVLDDLIRQGNYFEVGEYIELLECPNIGAFEYSDGTATQLINEQIKRALRNLR